MRSIVIALAAVLSLSACVSDAPNTPDSSTDSSSTDVSVADTNTDVDAGTSYCTDHKAAAYCEDFDRALAPWSLSVSTQTLGTFAANDSAFTSPPRSVAFNLQPASSAFQGVYLGAVIPTSSAKGARLTLAMRIDQADPTPGSLDFLILRTDGVGGVTMHRTTTANTDAWSFGPSFEPIDTPTLNKWLPVVVDVTFDKAGADAGGGGTATLTLDGKTYAPIPSNVKPPTSTVGLLLGGQSIAATSPKMKFSIDDVVVELK